MKKLVMMSLILVLMVAAAVWAQSGRRAQTADAVTLKGEITNVLKPLAQFKAAGKEYTVHLGPLWYWNQEKLELAKGAAEIVGETEEVDGAWHLYPNKIVQGKVEIVLASDDGTPKWSQSSKGTRMGGRGGHGCGHHQRCCGGGGCRR